MADPSQQEVQQYQENQFQLQEQQYQQQYQENQFQLQVPQLGVVPGQSFVGPPLLDGQALLQAQPQFQTAPLQIGIPGGFQFMPSPEQQFQYYTEPTADASEEVPVAAEGFGGIRTRDAVLTKKGDGVKGCLSCWKK